MGDYEDYINALKRLETIQKVIPNAALGDYKVQVEHNEPMFIGVKETCCKYTIIERDKDSIITCLAFRCPRKE